VIPWNRDVILWNHDVILWNHAVILVFAAHFLDFSKPFKRLMSEANNLSEAICQIAAARHVLP